LKLPRAWLEEGSLDFSFSGLKTSVLNHCNTLRMSETLTDQRIDDVCASFQQAVVDVLVEKAIQAARIYDLETIVLGGGVSANRILREQMTIGCHEKGITLCLPTIENCTDNAAMIAFAGSKKFEFGMKGNFDDDVFSRSYLGR
jgi:N6-L-threonylcarbamoyladenine synthase